MNESHNNTDKSNSKNTNKNEFFRFIKNFDIFGIVFNFRVESEEKFQSSN